MSKSFQYDVFLSHNAKDKPRVRALAERLKQAGLRVWFDDWIVRPGEIIALKVDEGLEQSRVLLLCISPSALASGWVALERSTAIHRDPANEGRRFIPLLLADCELPDTLRRYKYVDFRGEAEAAFAELVTACRPEATEAPPAEKPSPAEGETKKKPQPAKTPEETEPLAVLERKLPGHNERIYSLVFAPNGEWFASGGREGIKIWDFVSITPRLTLTEQPGIIRSLAVSPDGQLLLSASQADKSVQVWDAQKGLKLRKLTKDLGEAFGIAVLPDGKRALSGSRLVGGVTLLLWDFHSGECLRTYRGHKGGVWAVAVTGDGRRAVSASGEDDGELRLWDIERGTCLSVLAGHSRRVLSVQISPNERFAVSGSEDKTVKVWDLEAGSCVGTLEGHKYHVDSVAISPDGDWIASTGLTDHTVRLWDLKSGTCLQLIRHENWTPLSVAFSPDGMWLVVGVFDGPIYIYRLTRVRPTISADAARRYVNAKVVLLGEGTVGKTSLAHRLIGDEYVIRDRTHGMNVWPLELPLPADATLEREALLWDLAGQEDYRLIHQLFLDETALALLLVNPQNHDPFAEAGDWLKALKTAMPGDGAKREAARLLIFSQIDVGGMKLGDAKIERFRQEHGFADWLPTSAKTGENCSDRENGGHPSKLKQLIAGSIPWEKLAWTSTPRLLAELKNAVMKMRDEQDIRLLRFAELTQRLEQALPGEKFGESEVRTAVTLLGNHGLARALKFGDLVLLQPELLNGYAGAIIRAARAHTDEIGCVLEEKIYRPDFNFTGVERLKHPPDEELLLRALVQTFLDHSLCIAEETPQGRHLVFPSQYRREKDSPKSPDVFVSYKFSGEWQTVWTTLVVRLWYSQEFQHRELWRNAAEFASNKEHTLGLMVEKIGDGAATISCYFDVEVADELKAMFIEYVHRHLARYGSEVSRDRRYVCANPKCRKPVKDLEAVRKRLEAKKDFITCQECDERVLLIDFLEQRLKSDPVARQILKMEEEATRQLDSQALEQILIGHMMAIAGEANQIFRPVTMFDHGIDGEVEFKDDDGKASGKRIYIQLKSGNSYLRSRKSDGSEVFDVKNERHLDYWVSQPVDVYLVIRQTDEMTGGQTIRWMNVTRYLKDRKDKKSRQIVFQGEKLDMEAVWRARDEFWPPQRVRAGKR